MILIVFYADDFNAALLKNEMWRKCAQERFLETGHLFCLDCVCCCFPAIDSFIPQLSHVDRPKTLHGHNASLVALSDFRWSSLYFVQKFTSADFPVDSLICILNPFVTSFVLVTWHLMNVLKFLLKGQMEMLRVWMKLLESSNYYDQIQWFSRQLYRHSSLWF